MRSEPALATESKPVGTRRDPTTDELAVLAYARLKEIANGFFARVPAGHTLQPTALVHEAYLRMASAEELGVHDYEHFVAVGARAMRQVLVDHYRRSSAGKRGGGHLRVTLHDFAAPGTDTHVDVEALDAALNELEALSPRQARVVELRFFGGFTMQEIARATEISLATAEREWRRARAWLRLRLEAPAGQP